MVRDAQDRNAPSALAFAAGFRALALELRHTEDLLLGLKSSDSAGPMPASTCVVFCWVPGFTDHQILHFRV